MRQPDALANDTYRVPVTCTCADLLPVDQEYAPCPVHGWTVAPDQQVCREDVWDGPFKMTCGRVLINGKCGRHATGT